MDVIRHYNIFMQNDVGKMFGNFQPAFFRNFSGLIQQHLAVQDFTKKMLPFVADERHKIPSRRRIIISGQAYGTAIGFHICKVRAYPPKARQVPYASTILPCRKPSVQVRVPTNHGTRRNQEGVAKAPYTIFKTFLVWALIFASNNSN